LVYFVNFVLRPVTAKEVFSVPLQRCLLVC